MKKHNEMGARQPEAPGGIEEAGTVKLRRSSQNTGARGLSSCRVRRAAPLRRGF
jgi:hypothetical protein